MGTTGIFLDQSVLSSLQPEVLDAILQAVLQHPEGDSATPALESSSGADTTNQPAVLSYGQASKFVEGCSPKSKATVRAIVSSPSREFLLSDIDRVVAPEFGALDRVWGGLTNRVRTVTGNREAYLIWWVQVGDDWKGMLAEPTYLSLRRALEID